MKREWQLEALTPICTGDANRSYRRLIPSGIMGSLRWWFEVLVRGLGGKACDPTAKEVRCEYDPKDPRPPEQQLCVACYLFGCTGWACKFRLMILDANGQRVIQDQIQAGQKFTLRFIPLRTIAPEEWCLLDATLRLIADYGAMGGKTVFKPSEEPNRQNARHHEDFGLIAIEPRLGEVSRSRAAAETYVRDTRWRDAPHSYRDCRGMHDFSWASLQNFWCVKGRYLTRTGPDESSFNQVLERNPSKRCKRCNQVHLPGQKCPQTNRYEKRYSDDPSTDPIDTWLAGSQQESKKVFSFKHPEDTRRTFGFVKPGLVDFDEMKCRLGQVWANFQPESEFQTGDQILNELFNWEEGQ